MADRKTRISAKVRYAVTLMVEHGLNRASAAEKAGLKDNSLYIALRKPDVCSFRLSLMQVFRESAASRSISRVDVLADTAESEHVRLKSNELLLGIEGIAPVQRVEGRIEHAHVVPGLTIVYDTRQPSLVDVTPGVVDEVPAHIRALPAPVPHPSMASPSLPVLPMLRPNGRRK